MYVRGEEEGVREWVGVVHVSSCFSFLLEDGSGDGLLGRGFWVVVFFFPWWFE